MIRTTHLNEVIESICKVSLLKKSDILPIYVVSQERSGTTRGTYRTSWFRVCDFAEKLNARTTYHLASIFLLNIRIFIIDRYRFLTQCYTYPWYIIHLSLLRVSEKSSALIDWTQRTILYLIWPFRALINDIAFSENIFFSPTTLCRYCSRHNRRNEYQVILVVISEKQTSQYSTFKTF